MPRQFAPQSLYNMMGKSRFYKHTHTHTDATECDSIREVLSKCLDSARVDFVIWYSTAFICF